MVCYPQTELHYEYIVLIIIHQFQMILDIQIVYFKNISSLEYVCDQILITM